MTAPIADEGRRPVGDMETPREPTALQDRDRFGDRQLLVWHGYNLGLWSDDDEEDAQAALRGDHYITGEKRAQQRVKVGKL